MSTTFLRLGDGLKGTTKVALAQGQRFVALFIPIDATIISTFDLSFCKSLLIFPNPAFFHHLNIQKEKTVSILEIWNTHSWKIAP
jgi:hypothetical protein